MVRALRPKDNRLQVTIVAHHVGAIGGMERQLAELIRGLLVHGHEVMVISRRCDMPQHPALRWIPVRVPEKPFLLGYTLFFLAGTYLVWRHRIGLVHTTGALVWNRADLCTTHLCHYAFRDSVGAAAAIGRLHRRLNRRLSGALARFGEWLVYRPWKVREYVAVSAGLAREISSCHPELAEHVRVIPNGVDHDVFRPDPEARIRVRQAYGLSDTDFVVLFVGGDWERKGLHLAIEAVARVQDCRLLVVGSGDTKCYHDMANTLGCGNRIIFTGPQQQTAHYYAAADVFLLPSAYETFSLVTFEAAASGLPLLVTRVSGVEEILRDGENGWFVSRDPLEISLKIEALLLNDESRKAMGTRSRESVAEYSWKGVVARYLSLYWWLAGRFRLGSHDADPPMVTAGTS